MGSGTSSSPLSSVNMASFASLSEAEYDKLCLNAPYRDAMEIASKFDFPGGSGAAAGEGNDGPDGAGRRGECENCGRRLRGRCLSLGEFAGPPITWYPSIPF